MQTVTDTARLVELRRSDYARLDAGGHVYLDYTGAGLYGDSQLDEHLALLRTELVERARAAVLDFFARRPRSTPRSSRPTRPGALRLVGEAYPFRPGDRFLLTFDNHNSVNGIRDFARARGAETSYVPSVAPECGLARISFRVT
jgi:molybdenum cofactor sulfurtransferase